MCPSWVVSGSSLPVGWLEDAICDPHMRSLAVFSLCSKPVLNSSSSSGGQLFQSSTLSFIQLCRILASARKVHEVKGVDLGSPYSS